MDNIYDQTEHERNSIVQIPEKFAENAGNTLYSWLGSLWRSIHKGDDMVRGLQQARGIRLAQLYIDILEAAQLKDRNGAPVFHRELWHPIIIRRSQRNKSQENLLVIGGDADKKIGKQPGGGYYEEGTEFEIGRMAAYSEYVTYPIDAEIAGGALSIVDNIIKPAVSMSSERGDFVIRNNTIIFPSENDPLADGSPFERDDLPNIIDNDGTPGSDVEAVLWASDVLIDKDYVADHISYALGADAPSSDVVKRIINAAWSATTDGLTVELVQTLVAAMLNVPVIQNETETVTDISGEFEDGTLVATVVRTDKGSYRISPKAKLRETTKTGAVLKRGMLLDKTVRFYPRLNVDSTLDSEISEELKVDIPSVVIPPEILRGRTNYGIFAMWGDSKVKQADDDENHLYFDVGGDPDDVEAFWKDVWKKSASDGIPMESIIGEKDASVSPARFFLRNLVGANTLFIVVDTSMADDASMMRDPMFFDMLSDVVPSAMRLFLVEHSSVNEDKADVVGAYDGSVDMKAALPAVSEGAEPSEERVSYRFVRATPVKTRGKKEE